MYISNMALKSVALSRRLQDEKNLLKEMRIALENQTDVVRRLEIEHAEAVYSERMNGGN